MKTCPACGSTNMVFESRDVSFDYKHERLVVEQVRGWFCQLCNEALFADGEGAVSYTHLTLPTIYSV